MLSHMMVANTKTTGGRFCDVQLGTSSVQAVRGTVWARSLAGSPKLSLGCTISFCGTSCGMAWCPTQVFLPKRRLHQLLVHAMIGPVLRATTKMKGLKLSEPCTIGERSLLHWLQQSQSFSSGTCEGGPGRPTVTGLLLTRTEPRVVVMFLRRGVACTGFRSQRRLQFASMEKQHACRLYSCGCTE